MRRDVIDFDYPESWILVTYPPLSPGGAFFDLHNTITALETTPKEDTGLAPYRAGDFSMRLLVYNEGWAGSAFQTARVESQRLFQYHYVVSEPGHVSLGGYDAAQVVFGTRARDGAYVIFSLDARRWLLASLSAAVGELDRHLPAAYDVLRSVRVQS